MTTLHLTKDEIAKFEKLPAALREGWVVEEETLKFTDTPDRMRLRAEFAKVHEDSTKELIKKIGACASSADAEKLLKEIDPKKISDLDTMEFAFVIGPDGLSALLAASLESVTNDDGLAAAAGLSGIRHELLASLQNFA